MKHRNGPLEAYGAVELGAQFEQGQTIRIPWYCHDGLHPAWRLPGVTRDTRKTALGTNHSNEDQNPKEEADVG